jgi:membrane associated rhomboid family serine protease
LRAIADAESGQAVQNIKVEPRKKRRTCSQRTSDRALWAWDNFLDFVYFWFGNMRFDHAADDGDERAVRKGQLLEKQKILDDPVNARQMRKIARQQRLKRIKVKKKPPGPATIVIHGHENETAPRPGSHAKQLSAGWGKHQSSWTKPDPSDWSQQQDHEKWKKIESEWVTPQVGLQMQAWSAGAVGASSGWTPSGQAVDTSGVVEMSFSFPVFTVAWPLLVFSLWIFFYFSHGTSYAGLESIWPDQTDLAVTSDCVDFRGQIWRWWTYQFTHVGFMHAAKNSVMMLILGFGLEGASWDAAGDTTVGPWRLAFMFNVGVFGGACFYFILDCHTRTVGMSGGVYSLLGLNIADQLMNLDSEYAYATLFFLFFLVGVDVLETILSHTPGVSWAAHAGGGIYGLLIGILVGKNTRVQSWEKVVRLLALVTIIVLTLFCIIWLSTGLTRTIDEQWNGVAAWCWHRQVQNITEFGDVLPHCVRCDADQACIDRYSAPLQQHSSGVALTACITNGWTRTSFM